MTRGAGVLIQAQDTRRYLLQLRGPGARSHEGYWDISAGGRSEPGEQETQTVLRKLAEELGPYPELTLMRSVTRLFTNSEGDSAAYTAFLGACTSEFCVQGGTNREAVTCWEWMTAADAGLLELHPSFERELLALGIVHRRP